MKLHIVAVFLSLLLYLQGAELASESQIHYGVNYTLITANSPDCINYSNSSLAGDYPVIVLGNSTATGEWKKLEHKLGEPQYFFGFLVFACITVTRALGVPYGEPVATCRYEILICNS